MYALTQPTGDLTGMMKGRHQLIAPFFWSQVLLCRRTSQKCFNKQMFAFKNSLFIRSLKDFPKEKRQKNFKLMKPFLKKIMVF